MSDRIPSDHDAVETARGTLERVGRTDRLRIVVPDAARDAVPTEEVVRLVLDGDTTHARVETDLEGRSVIDGAYDSPSLARSPGDATNRLAEWVTAAGLAAGDSVLLDIVTDGFLYGLREPGTRTVYEAVEAPDDDLSAIARDLGE